MVVLLGLILMVLIYIGNDIDTIRRMIFEMRLCPECHGTGRIPEERDLEARNAELAKAPAGRDDRGSERGII